MARPNVRVNGQNLEDLNEDEVGVFARALLLEYPLTPSLSIRTNHASDTEPFDEGFDRHIWSLSDQSLRWDLQIAKERRTKPEEIEKQMRELLAAQQELDAEEAAAMEDVADVDGRTQADSAWFTYSPFISGPQRDLVPAAAYERINEVAAQTFALAEELKQVRLRRA